MQKLLCKITLGALVLAMSATMATAQVDVELAFNPNVAGPGDEVTFFSSIAHMGSEAAVADVELTISFGEFSFGPIAGQMPMAAGMEKSSEFAFIVPPLPMDVTLTIMLTVTVGEHTDTTTATLTIEAGDFPMPFAAKDDTEEALRNLGRDLAGSIIGETTAVQEESFGAVKNRYRR
jgi:hypothetical protein